SLLMNALLPQKNYPLLPPSLPSAPRSRSLQLSPLSRSSALHILLASLPPLSPSSQASAGPPYRSLSPASLSPSLSVPAPCTPATTLLPSSLSHFLLPPPLPSSPHIPPVLLLLSPLPLPSPPPALSTLPPPLLPLSDSPSPSPAHPPYPGTPSLHHAPTFL